MQSTVVSPLLLLIKRNLWSKIRRRTGRENDKMQSSTDLRSLLSRIDHRGYPAYKDTKGTYQFPGYVLSIDHVQGDPFASQS